MNVAAFHAPLAPQGLGIAALITAATIYLPGPPDRAAFAPLLTARAAAASAPVRIVEAALGLAFIASGWPDCSAAPRRPRPSPRMLAAVLALAAAQIWLAVRHRALFTPLLRGGGSEADAEPTWDVAPISARSRP